MRLRRRRIFVLGAVALLVCGVAWRRRRVLPVSATPAPIQTGTISGSMDFGGQTRTYLLHIPTGYYGKAHLPLVFVLHGATESNDSVENLSGMSAKADREHFIAVYPRGTGRLPTWNAGNCCGYGVVNHVDDAGFFRALLEKLEGEYAVDRKRVYFTGISNGAMMSYRIACEMSEQVAAIAPVEGALKSDCHPAVPVSVLIFHGTADRLVPFNGSTRMQRYNSVAYAVDFWVRRDGCSTAPAHEETEESHTDKYSGCRDGTGVALYAIQGGRHMWPGHPLSGNSVPATDLMWSFFAAHPKS